MPPKRSLTKRRSFAQDWYDPLITKNTSVINHSSSRQHLWIDALSPSTVKEVAVHHEKIRELSEVLSYARSCGKGIILLTGPPGSAKSTCFSAVCRELVFSSKIHRYGDEDTTGGADEMENFEDFLFRSARYTDVCTHSKNSSGDAIGTGNMRVILIEQFPIGICDQVTRFHAQLRSFLSRVLLPTVLVFILTKSNSPTLASSSTSQFDNATINRMFPPTIKEDLSIMQVDFNAIAPSILTRALNRIIKLAGTRYGLLPPSHTFVQKLVSSSSGDLRLAINNLQFMMIGANSKSSLEGNINLKNRALEFYERDSSILLFHALGKILHGKRIESNETSESLLPENLRHWRRLPLSFVPECVLDQCGVSGEEIVSWIHENYTQFFTDLPSLESISSSISFADSHLTGGMNWRLGLTPAADRNSETSTFANGSRISFASASDNYSAIFVSRAVLLVPRQYPPGTGPGFKALRAPKSRNASGRLPVLSSLLEQFSNSCSSMSTEPNSAADHIHRSVVCGFRQTLLERLPLELQITNSDFSNRAFAEEFVSLCKFSSSNATTNKCARSKSLPFRAPLRLPDCSMDSYCSSADAAEGAAVNIDENFSDSETHL